MTRRYTAHCRVVYEDETGLEKVFYVTEIIYDESELTPEEIFNRLTRLKEGVNKGEYKSITLASLGDSPFKDLLPNPPHYP